MLMTTPYILMTAWRQRYAAKKIVAHHHGGERVCNYPSNKRFKRETAIIRRFLEIDAQASCACATS
jgi:hypothetical protein